MTLLGFLFTYPRVESSEKARSAIDQAVAVFDIFSQSFAVSASAARIVRELGAKAEAVLQEAQPGQTQAMVDAPPSLALTDLPLLNSVSGDNTMSAASVFDESVDFGGLLQMACDVEQFIDLGMLWPQNGGVNMDPWLGRNESTISVS